LNEPTATSHELEQNAMAEYQNGNWSLAAQLFNQAREAYEQQGDPLKSAEMSNNLCVTLLQDQRPQEALAVVEGTWNIFLSHVDDLRAAQAYGNLAAAQEACGDSANAEKAYAKAAKLLEKTGDDEARAQTLAALSRLQLKRGKPVQAVASMQSGLEGRSRLSIGRRFLRWLISLPGRILNR
jgi:tetratricopeptide (TPR) repeat protein